MKSLYEAIKSSYMAYITLHNLPLEIQLPPYLDSLLHISELDSDLVTEVSEAVQGFELGAPEEFDDDASFSRGWGGWGNDMSVGWKLPPLVPWKSLLLLDDSHKGLDPSVDFRDINMRNQINPEDRTLVEGLIRFLDTASVTLS
jgi:nitrogen permease regulator 3-like protein